jgi:uncharacterized phiE125 gp8 family phage protein
MLRIVDRPTSFPVSLAEAKAQLRVTTTSNDLVINGLIATATRACETLVQRVFASWTFEWVLPCWRSELRIPIAPVAADGIASIKYVDWASQAQQTLDKSAYVVQTRGDSVAIIPKFGTAWPLVFAHASEPIVVQFDAGYDDPADVPPNVKTAILLQLRHLYSLGEINLALTSDTVFGVGQKQFQARADTAGIIPDAVRNLMLAEVW